MATFWFWYSRILPCGTNHMITKWWKPLKNATFHTFDGCKKILVGCLASWLVSKVALHPREVPEKIWGQYNKSKSRNFQKSFPPPENWTFGIRVFKLHLIISGLFNVRFFYNKCKITEKKRTLNNPVEVPTVCTIFSWRISFTKI